MTPIAMQPDLRPFLRLQLRARLPLEAWLAHHMHLPPPGQVTKLMILLEDDIGSVPEDPKSWSGHPQEALGLAWLLAGSSLGNRAILTMRRKVGLSGGEAFLADEMSPAYWQQFKPCLEREYGETATRHAVAGARRGFDHFLELVGEPLSMVSA